MKIKDLIGVNKIADGKIDSDLVNWVWDYISNEIKTKYSKKSAWIYFIVVDGIIRKVGGTGMKLIDRVRFYFSANYWTDKPGYCNAATNPIIFHYLKKSSKVELYAIKEDIPSVEVNVMINGQKEKVKTNVDFRPIEKRYRQIIEEHNSTHNILNEDLDLDGKALQLTLIKLKLKEVNIKINKRVQEGMKYIQKGKKWVLTKI